MKRWIYFLLAIVGIILPMSQFIPASVDGEFTVGGMIDRMTADRTITGVTLDFLVVVITGLVFGIFESFRLQLRWAWISLVGTFLIGASFGLPFLLFLRESALQRKTKPLEGEG